MKRNIIRALAISCLLPWALSAQEYGYDAAGRLTSAWYPSGQAIAFSYDPAGNLINRGVFADQDLDGIHDEWEINFFGSIAAANPLDDDEKDTLVNIIEFALGRDPTASDGPQVTVLSMASEGEHEYLEFTYRRAKLGTLFISYRPEISFDAQTWLSGPTHVQQISETVEIDPETEELKFRVLTPIGSANRIFLRLNISKRE